MDMYGGEEAMAKLNPDQRLGTPEDIAGAVIYLSSRASSHINGACLTVDGVCIIPDPEVEPNKLLTPITGGQVGKGQQDVAGSRIIVGSAGFSFSSCLRLYQREEHNLPAYP